MIRATLKEGSKPQRVIIKTYNYDLRNNKEISLAEVLKIEDLDEDQVQKDQNPEDLSQKEEHTQDQGQGHPPRQESV